MTSIHINKIESFRHYSNFKSQKDFNTQIEMFLAIHKKEFTPTEFMLFRRLTKYSIKVPGISNASIRTILTATSKHDLHGKSVSESTFHRMKRKAMRLGILEAKETKREDGSQSANLWIFKDFRKSTIQKDTPYKVEEQPEIASDQHVEKTEKTPHEASNTVKANILDTRSTGDDLDDTFVPKNVDKSFIDTVKPFFNKARDIYNLWLLVVNVYERTKIDLPMQELQETVNHAFKTTVFYHKQGRIKKTFKSYFSAVLSDYFDVAYRENIYQSGGVYFNWLEEW